MWSSVFSVFRMVLDAAGATVDFVRKVTGKRHDPEPVDAAAQRSGTAAGAAASEASHRAGKAKP